MATNWKFNWTTFDDNGYVNLSSTDYYDSTTNYTEIPYIRTPEELAKQYVEDYRKYKQYLREVRINNLVRKYAKTYNKKYVDKWIVKHFEPKLPTPADRKKIIRIYNKPIVHDYNNNYYTISYNNNW